MIASGLVGKKLVKP